MATPTFPAAVAPNVLHSARPGERLARLAEAHWRDAMTGVVHVLEPVQAAALEALQCLDTRLAHVERLASALGLEPARSESVLDELAARGLFGSLDALLPPPPAPQVSSDEPLITIKTCRRPQALARLLDSLADDARRRGARREILVIDDSGDASAETVTRGLAEAHGHASRDSIQVFATAERERLLGEFERILAPAQRAAARAMLCPRTNPAHTSARSTNWSALLAAGRVLAPLDDDFHLPARRPTGVRAGIDPRRRPRCSYIAVDDPGELQRLDEVGDDPFASAASLLGRGARDLIGQHGVDPAHAHGVPIGEWQHLLRPGSRVVATTQGLYGSLHVNHSLYLNYDDPQALAALWREPWNPARLEGRSVLMTTTSLRLLPEQYMLPQCIDARDMIAFGARRGRADDTLWMVLTAAMAGTMLVAHLPQALGHHQVEDRHRVAQTLRGPPIDANEYVTHWLGQIGGALASNDRRRRLAVLAAYADDVARCDDTTLLDDLRRWHQNWLALRLGELEAAVARGGDRAPPGWRTFVDAVIAHSQHALAEDHHVIEVAADVRAAFRHVAEAAAFWPALWEHMRNRAQDV